MTPAPSLRLSPALVCTALLAFGGLFSAPSLLAWTPGTSSPNAVQGFVVDPLDRMDVLSFYHCIYTASQNFAANMLWTGSTAAGVAGSTSATFKDDVRRRINFYRALVSLPADITFDATKSSKCQQAALMFSANNALSHSPPTSWLYYTAAGAEAAFASNIALGTYGPAAVDGFMRDDGPGNQIVGHRRWLHYSRAAVMGTGDVPPNGSAQAANAIWVIGDFKPVQPPQFVAWPNRGFVPFHLMPARWSLSYPDANFSGASVAMSVGGVPVTTQIVSNADNGYGENTVVWQIVGLPTSITSDVLCSVTVSGITGAGVPASYSYQVTLFDPNRLGASASITGSANPPTTGAPYTFTSIPRADAYELRVSTGSTAAWAEGAEETPVPQILPRTTGTYALRQSAVTRTGTRAFQLCTPTFDNQTFEITRDIVPSSTSQLVFYDLCRFATTTTTLSAEVSNDGGDTWASVFSRPGVGLSSTLWDASFISRSISLAAYTGQQIRVRFILRWNGASVTTGTNADFGFFIDDITVTNATILTNTIVTALPASATSFMLNQDTAGAALAVGTRYFMRIRPNVGCRWFGDGPLRSVLAQAPTPYDSWVAANHPAVISGPQGDHDGDGIRNGEEFAFGLNPTVSNPASALPQPVRSAGSLALSYVPPAGVTGVTYGAQWSENLVQWFDLTNDGGGPARTFTVSTSGRPRLFMRHRITVGP